MGLEPTRRNRHQILSLARLPIPTPPQIYGIKLRLALCLINSSNRFVLRAELYLSYGLLRNPQQAFGFRAKALHPHVRLPRIHVCIRSCKHDVCSHVRSGLIVQEKGLEPS